MAPLARAALLVTACAAAPLARAQQPPPRQVDTALANSQQRLIEIRRERERLEADMERLRGRVHSLSSEVQNIQQQVQTTGRIVSELDLQVTAMGSQIQRKTADLIVAQDALAEKRAILEHRLIEISKRGPLHAAQVLLGAESFGDLLSRYKYLYLASRQDRQLVAEVQALRDSAAARRRALLDLQDNLSRRRDERAEENRRYRRLEQQSEHSLQESRRDADRTARRLEQLARDEARINDIITALERRRAAAERRGAAAAPARIRTTDLGRLDWPVEGDIIYRFGRQQLPNSTVIRWNGVGIAVPSGTAVHAIADGTVRVAQALGTYGNSVVLDHGGGFYSVYGFLSRIDVSAGQQIRQGQVIGLSGGATSDQGPHLHFEIRGEGGRALDPIAWLRRRQ
jgi:septal ring factor EnvC (AmiA/AmiB activator)